MFVISGLVDIGTLMTRYGVTAVTSPVASPAAPMIASAPSPPLPRTALVLAAVGRLIVFSASVNADSVACPVVPAARAVQALAEAGLARKKVRADDLPSPTQ
jgi:hypothetical protein